MLTFLSSETQRVSWGVLQRYSTFKYLSLPGQGSPKALFMHPLGENTYPNSLNLFPSVVFDFVSMCVLGVVCCVGVGERGR